MRAPIKHGSHRSPQRAREGCGGPKAGRQGERLRSNSPRTEALECERRKRWMMGCECRVGLDGEGGSVWGEGPIPTATAG